VQRSRLGANSCARDLGADSGRRRRWSCRSARIVSQGTSVDSRTVMLRGAKDTRKGARRLPSNDAARRERLGFHKRFG
jgi:hypothetical protein